MSPEEARLRLEREGMRRVRMSGLLRARMTGLEGLLASADVDVVLESPARVFLSVRSFFEQPMYVLATNGVTVTVLDATAAGGPAFFAGPVDGDALAALLGLDLWPHEAVALFLGVAPAPGAEPVKLEIDPQAGTYTLALEEPRGRLSVVTARLEDDALLAWTGYGPEGAKLFTMRYDELRPEGDVPFPHRWDLRVFTPDGERGVRFDAKQIEVNGPPADPALFRLEAPPGVPVRPLVRGGAAAHHASNPKP